MSYYPELYRCPECTKKGVTFRPRLAGEDHYACRYCDFFAFSSPDSPNDFLGLLGLESMNQSIGNLLEDWARIYAKNLRSGSPVQPL